MRHSGSLISGRKFLFLSAALLILSFAISYKTFAQGTNNTGNGGRHAIQGKIYMPSGQRIGITNLLVRLESMSGGDLTVFADINGSFVFKNLTAGSYYIVIKDFEPYKDVRENAYIDDPGSSTFGSTIAMAATNKIVNLPIHLELDNDKEFEMPPGVVSAELENAPPKAAEHFRKAAKLSSNGDLEKAIAELKQAIAIHPEFAMAYNELGRLYGTTGDRNRAIESFRSAVKISPNSFDAKLNLGCGLVEMKSNEEAAQTLNEAIRLNLNSVRAFYCMGIAQMQMQNLLHAEKALSRAVQLNGGKYSKAHLLLGGIYWSEKKYKQAVDELEKYLKLEPNAKDADQTRKAIAELRTKQN